MLWALSHVQQYKQVLVRSDFLPVHPLRKSVKLSLRNWLFVSVACSNWHGAAQVGMVLLKLPGCWTQAGRVLLKLAGCCPCWHGAAQVGMVLLKLAWCCSNWHGAAQIGMVLLRCFWFQFCTQSSGHILAVTYSYKYNGPITDQHFLALLQ